MKRISMIILACLLMLTAATAFAQTRTRRSTSSRRSRAASTKSPDNTPTTASSLRPAAARVAEQIKSLGKFLYLYGPISKDLATSEAGARNQSNDALQRNRAKLREVFEGYRVQMDELETMFSSSSELRQYYPRLLGVAASASRGEELVAAGRYDEAGRSLLDVMNRLTDALLEMR